MAVITVTAVIAGGDHVAGQLRVDLSEVYNSRDYKVGLLTDEKPTAPGGYTAGWLGVDLAQGDGTPYSAQFSQVGLLTDKDGIYWFVYAEPGVTCLRGNSQWGTCSNGRPCGCQGTVNDLVSLGSWHTVELVSYGQGYWIARVYTASGTPYDVAQIWSSSSRIYFAQSTTEEAYSNPPDPYLTARFFHWHPQYMVSGTGFREWPTSSGGNNSLIYVTDLNGQNSFCPQHYGATPNILGDERFWFAGTDGQQCSWLLFPSVHIYLPAILKNYS